MSTKQSTEDTGGSRNTKLRTPMSQSKTFRRLSELASRLDRAPEAPFPAELVEHLRLRTFPGDRGSGEAKVSAPKGFMPRMTTSLNLPKAKGIVHDGRKSIAPKSARRPLDAFIPRHLGVETIAKTVPMRIPNFDPGAVRPLIQAIGWDLGFFPWSCVGRLHVSRDGGPLMNGGTGFMVGPNLLMTASHVMPWDYSGNCSIEFVPAFYPGRVPRFGSTMVTDWYGVPHDGWWDQVFEADASDFVICRTADPIGNVCGWLGTQAFDDHDEYFDNLYTSIGYPDFANGYPTVELLAQIDDVDGDKEGRELETGNFAGPGWSGGPLFGWVRDDWRVVGICHGKETEFVVGIPPWNVNLLFAGGNRMVDLVYYGYDNYS
jgi:hypothetical protein